MKKIVCMFFMLVILTGCSSSTLSEVTEVPVDNQWKTRMSRVLECLTTEINLLEYSYEKEIILPENITKWGNNRAINSKYYYCGPIETFCLMENEEINKLTDRGIYVLYGDDIPLEVIIVNGPKIENQQWGIPFYIRESEDMSNNFFAYYTYEGLLVLVDSRGNHYYADAFYAGDEDLSEDDKANIDKFCKIAEYKDYEKIEIDLAFVDELADNMEYLLYNVDVNSKIAKNAKKYMINLFATEPVHLANLMAIKKNELVKMDVAFGDEVPNLKLIRVNETTSYLTRMIENLYSFPIYINGEVYGTVDVIYQNGEFDVCSATIDMFYGRIGYEGYISKKRFIKYLGCSFVQDGTIYEFNHVHNPIAEGAYQIVCELARSLGKNKIEKVKFK